MTASYSRSAIIRDYREGALSQRQIAEKHGVSRSTVQRTIREHAQNLTERQVAAVVGGRLSRGVSDWVGAGSAMRTVVPPPDYSGKWQTLDLDRTQLRNLDPAHLIDILVNISPDISRAVWDTL